jgi:hypothetical protein
VRCIRPLCHLSKEAKSGVFTPRSGRVLGEDGRPDKAGAEEFRNDRTKRKTTDKKGTAMEHLRVRANGAAFHVSRTGTGKPLLLLHGWPEFWLTWVMAGLADRFTLLAPDLRGFGDSDKPDGPFGPDQHTTDMLALTDALGITRAGPLFSSVSDGGWELKIRWDRRTR